MFERGVLFYVGKECDYFILKQENRNISLRIRRYKEI